ncbi:hypothetical protein ACIPSE_06480 [Streptomyces sp. NPDC090106]|uniref:hypothetical protein n=1 Tax=Streptomyces sp. NPDC090106 TaxID=3365946 RepID=UPI003805F215
MPVHQDSDPFEDRVAAALRDAGGTFDADRTALVDAGLARGRRLRLRRRAAVVGGAASLALVGVGSALLVSPGSGSPAADRSTVASKPSASSTVPPVSGDTIVSTLQEVLGYGKFTRQSGEGTDATFGPLARLVWDDGDGEALVSLSLGRTEPGSARARELTTCPSKVYTPYDDCTTTRLDDGSLLMVLQGYVYADQPEGTLHWSADLITADGRHVSLNEWNSPEEKGASVTRPAPPLDVTELQQAVTSPKWLPIIDAVPEEEEGPSAEPTPSQSTTGVPDVGKHLVDLLPAGLDVVTRSREEDASAFGYVVVDDGRGRSLVQVNVQPDMGDMVGTPAFSGAETLDDGTLVAEQKSGGDKDVAGQAMWTVDTLRPDGFRVVISAFNAGTQHEAPTRTAPALSMEQLREIALSTTWLP